MEQMVKNLERRAKLINDISTRIWDFYLKGFENSLQLTKSWTEIWKSTADMARDTQEKLAALTSETIKTIRDSQLAWQESYADMTKKAWESFSPKSA